MKETVVSVIIAAYNAEDHIESCLSSVLNQSYKHIEVIVVDDGSNDNTGMICDSLSKGCSNLRVIHQQNRGVGFARNTGLENCTGEFVTFVDSDDVISSNYVEKLLTPCVENNLDIAICSFQFLDEGKAFNPKESAEYSVYDIDYRVLKHNNIARCCGTLLRRNAVGATRFDCDLFVGEDLLFFCQIINKSERMAVLRDELYCYYEHGESLTNGVYDKRKYTEMEAWNRVVELFSTRPFLFKNALHRMRGWVAFKNLVNMKRTQYNGPSEYATCVEALRKELSHVINPLPGGDKRNPLLHFVYIVMCISPGSGYEMLSALIELKHRLLAS